MTSSQNRASSAETVRATPSASFKNIGKHIGTVKLRRSKAEYRGARTVVMPRWLCCAIAPPLLIGRSEASIGRRDGAVG